MATLCGTAWSWLSKAMVKSIAAGTAKQSELKARFWAVMLRAMPSGSQVAEGAGAPVGATEGSAPAGSTPAENGSPMVGYEVGAGGASGVALMMPTAPRPVKANEWVTNGYSPASGIRNSNIAPPPGGML